MSDYFTAAKRPNGPRLFSSNFDDMQYRANLLPFGRNVSGETVLATPQFLVDMVKAVELPGRVVAGESFTPDDVTKMALDTMGGSGLLSRAAPAAGSGLFGINVFHGGPHKWSPEPGFPAGRPRMDKTGTGEGAQAYGHGFYSAEAPGVALDYKRALSGDWSDKTRVANAMYDALNPLPDGDVLFKGNKYNKDDFISEAVKSFDKPDWWNNIPPGLRTATEKRLEGHVYKLDIPDADAAKFLDWDAPLSKQPESVQKALEGLNPYRIEYGRLKLGGLDIGGPAHKEELAGYWKGATESGESVMRVLEQAYGSKKAASEALRKAGIPGLKYFDQGSRAGGKGTRNYVTWDQDVLDRAKILERDGKPTSANAEPRLPSDIRPAKENLATVIDANTVGGRVAGDETVSIDSLARGASTSARAQKDIDNIADSMSGPDGFIERLIIDQDNNVIEGAHRLEALRKLGVKEVPVTRIIDPQASFTGDDIAAMEKAMSKIGPIHSDHKNQIISQLGDMLADSDVAGDFGKVAKVFDFPKGFEKHFEAALKILERE